MAIEVKTVEDFPKPGELFNFVQFYIDNDPRFFYDNTNIGYVDIVRDILKNEKIDFKEKEINYKKAPLLKGNDYSIVGLGIASFVVPSESGLIKFIYEEIDAKFDEAHFQDFSQKIKAKFQIKNSMKKLGE